MEIWQNVEGFEGLYKVSSKGRIKSLGNGKSTDTRTKVERIMSQRVKSNGYMQSKLHKNGEQKHLLVHRVVAKAFLLNPENKPEVNHKDGDKTNNEVSNLEWSTSSENQKNAFAIGLQKARRGKYHSQSIPINQLEKDGAFVKRWDSLGDVVRELGFNKTGITGCCKKRPKYNTAYGYKWEYANE